MTRVVFMGTPDFAVPSLKNLIETRHLVGVVTQPDRPAGRGQQLRPSPVKVVAREAGIPLYQPKSLRSEEAAAPLRQWRPDLIVVVAFGQILRPHVLNLAAHGCLNIHGSLLPRWRGASPIQHAILAGDAETGVTIMQMDAGMDTGPIFFKQAIPIEANDTAAALHDRLAALGAAVLANKLDDILNSRIHATGQDEAQATYAPLIKKEDGLLDWRQSSLEIDRRIRALTPWPGAYTTWQGQVLKIRAAQPIADPLPREEPGRVIQHQDHVTVLTSSGGLILQKIQLAGKREMAVTDFIHGQPDLIGSKLGS